MRHFRFAKRALPMSALLVLLAAVSVPQRGFARVGPPPVPETPEPTYEVILAVGLIGMGALAMRRKGPGSKDDHDRE